MVMGSDAVTVQVDETVDQLFQLDVSLTGASGTITMSSVYIELIR